MRPYFVVFTFSYSVFCETDFLSWHLFHIYTARINTSIVQNPILHSFKEDLTNQFKLVKHQENFSTFLFENPSLFEQRSTEPNKICISKTEWGKTHLYQEIQILSKQRFIFQK